MLGSKELKFGDLGLKIDSGVGQISASLRVGSIAWLPEACRGFTCSMHTHLACCRGITISYPFAYSEWGRKGSTQIEAFSMLILILDWEKWVNVHQILPVMRNWVPFVGIWLLTAFKTHPSFSLSGLIGGKFKPCKALPVVHGNPHPSPSP